MDQEIVEEGILWETFPTHWSDYKFTLSAMESEIPGSIISDVYII